MCENLAQNCLNMNVLDIKWCFWNSLLIRKNKLLDVNEILDSLKSVEILVSRLRILYSH